MAAKAVASPDPSIPPPGAGEDLYMVAMPMVTYRAISDEAMKRGLTFAQAMQQALNRWFESSPTPLKSQEQK